MASVDPVRGRPRRVLVCLNSLELGGTQINAVDFAAQLSLSGIESHLIGPRSSLRPGPSLFDVASDRGVSLEAYDQPRGMFAHARQLSAIAGRIGADLVHVYGMWGPAREAYWGPVRLGRRPWVHTVYEMSVSPVVHRHVPLMVGTAYLVEELQSRPGRTVLISPPVDVAKDSPDAPGGSEFRSEHGLGPGILIGIVSRLDNKMKRRAIEVAVDAMAELSVVGATLFVVGTGDAETELRERAGKINADIGRDAVRFVGPLADPRPAYAAADVMLGMGSSAARTLAFGTPLVVQGELGWSRVFDSSTASNLARNSFWSPEAVEDPVDDLARVIRPLLTDASLRAELGLFGREFAVQRFGLPAMSAELADLYVRAMADYGPRQWGLDLPREGARLAEKVGRMAGKGMRRGQPN